MVLLRSCGVSQLQLQSRICSDHHTILQHVFSFSSEVNTLSGYFDPVNISFDKPKKQCAVTDQNFGQFWLQRLHCHPAACCLYSSDFFHQNYVEYLLDALIL